VIRGRSVPERHRRIMDQLHKNAVLCEQQIARRLTPFRIRNQDMWASLDMRRSAGVEYGVLTHAVRSLCRSLPQFDGQRGWQQRG
jgi:hypothetical protein